MQNTKQLKIGYFDFDWDLNARDDEGMNDTSLYINQYIFTIKNCKSHKTIILLSSFVN